MGSRRAEQLREEIRSREKTRKDEVAGPRRYRVLAISLYIDQAESVEQTRAALSRAGFPRANRSLVIQTAIQRLHEDLKGKSEGEVLKYFAEQQLLRLPLATAESRKASRRPTRMRARPPKR